MFCLVNTGSPQITLDQLSTLSIYLKSPYSTKFPVAAFSLVPHYFCPCIKSKALCHGGRQDHGEWLNK